MSLSFRTEGDFRHLINIDDTSLHVETILWRIHKTSRSIGWIFSEDTTRISFSVDNITYDNILVSDIDFDGVAMDSQDDFITGISAMFPAYDTSAQGAASYLIYTAMFQQTGTDAPVVTVFENTLGGNVVWSRDSEGNYSGLLLNGFPDDLTHFAPFGNFGGDGSTYLPLWGGSGAILGYWTMYKANEDSIAIQVKNPSGVAVDLSTLIGTTKLYLPDVKVYEA